MAEPSPTPKPPSFEDLLCEQFQALGVPLPLRNVTDWCPGRRWELDGYWPQYKIAYEVQGGIFIRGGHTRGRGYIKDSAKLNAAQAMGIRLFWLPMEWIGQLRKPKTQEPYIKPDWRAAVEMKRVIAGEEECFCQF